MTRTSSELKMNIKAMGGIRRKCRAAVVRHELAKAKLADSSCIIDLTWGPHRRVAKAGP